MQPSGHADVDGNVGTSTAGGPLDASSRAAERICKPHGTFRRMRVERPVNIQGKPGGDRRVRPQASARHITHKWSYPTVCDICRNVAPQTRQRPINERRRSPDFSIMVGERRTTLPEQGSATEYLWAPWHLGIEGTVGTIPSHLGAGSDVSCQIGRAHV